MTLTVGQALWYVSQFSIKRVEDRGYQVTVTAAGRKWAELDKGRLRINGATLFADDGCGRCYLSRGEYIEGTRNLRACENALRQLKAWLAHRPVGKDVTEADIRTAAMLLGVGHISH